MVKGEGIPTAPARSGNAPLHSTRFRRDAIAPHVLGNKGKPMNETVRLSPPNSLIFIMDHASGVLPDDITVGLVAATPSCVAVGTLPEVDGETSITFTDSMDVIDASDLLFSGVISTPNHELSVCSASDERLLTISVLQPSTQIKVFANDRSEPDRIMILVK